MGINCPAQHPRRHSWGSTLHMEWKLTPQQGNCNFSYLIFTVMLTTTVVVLNTSPSLILHTSY
jgi:hypothetical protein